MKIYGFAILKRWKKLNVAKPFLTLNNALIISVGNILLYRWKSFKVRSRCLN